MTTHTRNTFMNIVGQHCAATNTMQTVEWLAKHHLLDITRCQALVAHQLVENAQLAGLGKVDAMVAAAEQMGCSYECVRKYIYYYKNE